MKLKVFKIKNHKFNKGHRDFYSKNGYLVIRGMFAKQEVNNLDKSINFFADEGWHNIMNPDRIEFLLSQSYKKFSKIKSQNNRIKFIENAKLTSSLFKSYLLDKRIDNLMFSVIGKKVSGLMTHVIFKHKSSKFSKMSWVPHQDNSYAKMEKNCYITANLFIHNANKDNGCLYLYPGTHKLGLMKFDRYFSYHAKSSHKPGNRIQKKFSIENMINLEVNAGDFLIMNGNLIHGSYPNNSKKYSRHLLSFNYGVKGKKFIPGITAQRKRFDFPS